MATSSINPFHLIGCEQHPVFFEAKEKIQIKLIKNPATNAFLNESSTRPKRVKQALLVILIECISQFLKNSRTLKSIARTFILARHNTKLNFVIAGSSSTAETIHGQGYLTRPPFA
ncbi:MAG: hypothetical protein P8J91_13865 [Pirellulaceae bacterium]|nr:hypothetical protein [Pirellulaceae bacterium]